MVADSGQNKQHTAATHRSESTWLLGDDAGAGTSSSAAAAEGSVLGSRKHAEADAASTGTIVAQEARRLVRNSTPVILSYLLQYSFTFINMYVLGQIGSDELAASGLVNMAIIVVIYSPAIGLTSALDTFCSTAFTASQDVTLVGFHLQRGIIAVTVQFMCIAPVLWFMEPILVRWLGQDPRIAMLCGSFMRVHLLGALPWMYYECVKRFLQAQEIMHVSTYILLAVTPIHVANNYLLVFSAAAGFGFLGAAAANVVTNWLMLATIVGYVRWCNRGARAAWGGGWTVHAVRSMPQYFQLALPSMIMVCAEWWILDLLALASSYLGTATLAAQGIAINTCSLTYQFPDGVSLATCNRVGNLLGQGRARRARLTAWLGVSVGVAIGVTTVGVAIAAAEWWGGVYSTDPRVVASLVALMPACAAFQMLDAVNSVASGVLRSLGRQDAGAAINSVAYYVLGFPLALYLTYGRPHAGVVGLWYGIGAGVALAVLLQMLICLRTNWRSEVRKCIDRVSQDSLVFVNDDEDEDDD
ncbi:ethionine resistance protein [Coemansia sp. BCRC 34490]|nr:ethionine resistance protein [Coemansia sp. BCRC 34490]